MPSKFTSNYQLCQWEANDRVLRTDFNADNAKIDAALAAKADKTSLNSLSNSISAHTSALSARNCKAVTGT